MEAGMQDFETHIEKSVPRMMESPGRCLSYFK